MLSSAQQQLSFRRDEIRCGREIIALFLTELGAKRAALTNRRECTISPRTDPAGVIIKQQLLNAFGKNDRLSKQNDDDDVVIDDRSCQAVIASCARTRDERLARLLQLRMSPVRHSIAELLILPPPFESHPLEKHFLGVTRQQRLTVDSQDDEIRNTIVLSIRERQPIILRFDVADDESMRSIITLVLAASSMLTVVLSQMWLGTYTTESTCDRTVCCCLHGQIRLRSLSANTLTVTSGLAGLCDGRPTFSLNTTFPTGLESSLNLYGQSLELSLSSDGRTLTARNPTNAVCNNKAVQSRAEQTIASSTSTLALVVLLITTVTN